MQRLIPVKIPWTVSPSTPFLELFPCGSEGLRTSLSLYTPRPKPIEHTYATFIAFWGHKGRNISQTQIGYSSVKIATDPAEISSDPINFSKTDSVIKVTFEEGRWSRDSGWWSEDEALNPAEFDHSQIPLQDISMEVESWLKKWHEIWSENGDCPDPSFYIVENSHWIAELKLEGFTHFIIVGHDEYIEVIARSWKWEEIQKLPEGW